MSGRLDRFSRSPGATEDYVAIERARADRMERRAEEAERAKADLHHSLRNMTANFRTSLLLVSDYDTRVLGMSIVRDAEALLKKHQPK